MLATKSPLVHSSRSLLPLLLYKEQGNWGSVVETKNCCVSYDIRNQVLGFRFIFLLFLPLF